MLRDKVISPKLEKLKKIREMDSSKLPSGLYPVSVPIGNMLDITFRAVSILKACDAVICEEGPVGRSMLNSFNVNKPIYFLNEHSPKDEIKQLFEELLITKDKAVAMISDAGTPCFADPGAELVQLCHDYAVSVYPVPGASSLMSALAASGLKCDKFIYYGFLSAKKEKRREELKAVKNLPDYDLVFLDAPYRLMPVLSDMVAALGKKRKTILFYKLTYPNQQIIRGTLEEIYRAAEKLPKGEFVLIIEKTHAERPKKHI